MATAIQTRIRFEVTQNRTNRDVWQVESIDFARDGACFSVEFYGYGSEERAREYAEWKNSLVSTIEERVTSTT